MTATETEAPDSSRAPEDLASEVERSEEHTSELQSRQYLVCRLLLEKKKSPSTSPSSTPPRPSPSPSPRSSGPPSSPPSPRSFLCLLRLPTRRSPQPLLLTSRASTCL